MAGANIHPPKFDGDFATWKRKMEVFFKTEFDILLIMKYDYAVPKDKEENTWTKKSKQISSPTERLSSTYSAFCRRRR